MIFLNPDDQHDLMARYGLKAPEVHIFRDWDWPKFDRLSVYRSEKEYPPVKFLFIGRLLKEKGVFELIQTIE